MEIINTEGIDVIFTDDEKVLIGLKYKDTTPEFEAMFYNNEFQAFKKMMVFCDVPVIVEPETTKELYEYCLENYSFKTEPTELYSVVEKHFYNINLDSEQNILPYKYCINIEKTIIEKLGKSAIPDKMVKDYEEQNGINNGREALKNNLEKEIKRIELAKNFIFDSCPCCYPEEWIIVAVDKKYGIINKDFKFAIKPKYQMLRHIKDNIFLAKLNDKFYSIDYSDNIITELTHSKEGKKYDDIEPFYDKFLKVKQHNEFIKTHIAYGIIDYKNNVILPLLEDYKDGDKSFDCYVDDDIAYFSFGFHYGGRYGIIDNFGNNPIPFEYSKKIRLYKDFAIVAKYDSEKNCSLYGTVDYKNKIKIPLIYKELNPIGHDLENITFAAIKFDEKVIIIDEFGKQICDMEFDYVDCLSDELYSVCINEKYGAIDRFGNIKIPFQDLYIDYFVKIDETKVMGYCFDNDWHCGLIDDKGNIVIPCMYEGYPFDYLKEFIIVPEYQTGFYGVIDWSNNKVIDFLYDLIIPFGNYYFVNIRDKWGFIDKQGNSVNLIL